MIAIKNILVPTDFSETAESAVEYALALARTFASTLHIIHVADDLAARAAFSSAPSLDFGKLQTELEDDARARLGAILSEDERRTLDAHLLVFTSTTPASSILSYATDASIDLIVMGTHGRTGLAHFFLGSVAQKVVRAAYCPVLTVRHPEREFVHPDALVAMTATTH